MACCNRYGARARFAARYVVAGRLVQPFAQTVHAGDYYLAWRKERRSEETISVLRRWLAAEAAEVRSVEPRNGHSNVG